MEGPSQGRKVEIFGAQGGKLDQIKNENRANIGQLRKKGEA